MGGRQRWPPVPSLWSPPYIGVKCGPLPQRNLLQTIAGKRLEHFFFISRASALPRNLAMHPGRPLIYSTVLAACSFGPRPSLIAPSPPADQWKRPPTVFASRCGATPTMVSNWPLGNTLPSGRLHEVGELKFGSGAVMDAY